MKNILTKIKQVSEGVFNNIEVGIDLGTSNTRIAISNKGTVLREPTYIGLNTKLNEYIFYGEEARQIYGKAPNFINVFKPIQNGIISDFDANVALIKYFIEKTVLPFFTNNWLIKNNLVGYATITPSSTEVEQKAIEESLIKSGLSKIYIIEKPIAVAYGAGLPVFSNKPIFIIDMGGGLIEISILIMGGIVTHKTIKQAGENMDKLIHNYLHLKYGMIVGDVTAENLKKTLFNLKDETNTTTVRGKSLENGLPKSIRVKSSDIKEALAANLNIIIDNIKEILETIPPEIIDEVIKTGIYLTGGLAKVPGIDDFIAKDLKIPVIIASSPEDATINGTMKLIKDKYNLKKVIIR